MRLIIVRHADPYYEIDSLTEVGWKEAELAAEKLSKMDIKAFYASPLGRAQDTANCTLKKMNRSAITYDWLREFQGYIIRPNCQKHGVTWDWLPEDWTKEPKYFDKDTWAETEIMKAGNVKESYTRVCEGLDALLVEYGYERNGLLYDVKEANNDTIVLFCHFGVECVLLAHLLNISPMQLWHGFCAAPSSMTTVYTEERREGIASWRVSAFGDVSHLYAGGREASFAARFCECYKNHEERHD